LGVHAEQEVLEEQPVETIVVADSSQLSPSLVPLETLLVYHVQSPPDEDLSFDPIDVP
jgi:hypothetical protein